jgi:formate/nitrite transporter FocA (FNT family)
MTESADEERMKRPDSLPNLTEAELEQVQERTTISAIIVHEAVREEGERELIRPLSSLAWSGLAAGLSMGFSLVGQGLIRTYLPPAPWHIVLDSFGYSLGFLIVVLGRQQLFTENTLTPILPLLTHRDGRTLLQVLRVWGVVLLTNVLGALAFALLVGHMSIFPPEVQRTFDALGHQAVRGDFLTTLLRAVFAGWLIALYGLGASGGRNGQGPDHYYSDLCCGAGQFRPYHCRVS